MWSVNKLGRVTSADAKDVIIKTHAVAVNKILFVNRFINKSFYFRYDVVESSMLVRYY